MSATGVIAFCLVFIAYSVYFSGSYGTLHLSKNAWLAVCIFLSAVFAVIFVKETFFSKKTENVD